jgi:hypothetical protein
VPSDKNKRALYATEGVVGAGLGLAAASDRIPEVVNGSVRLKRKADAWHARTRKEGGLGKTPDGNYVKLDRLSDRKPKKPATEFTSEGKPFVPKYEKKPPRVSAFERMDSEFKETKARAEHPNNVPFPEARWERYRVSGRKIKFKPKPGLGAHTKPKMVRTPAALGELRRFSVVGAGVPLGIAVGWHGAHKYMGLKDKQARKRVSKRRLDQSDVDGAIAGGLTGAAAYHAPSFMEWGGRGKNEAEETAEQKRIINEWKDKYNVHGKQKGTPGWKKAYHNYPDGVPKAKYRRIMSYTHTGKTGMALTTAAAAGGAAIGIPTVRALNRKVGKK